VTVASGVSSESVFADTANIAVQRAPACPCAAWWADGELVIETCDAHHAYGIRQAMKMVRKLGIPLAEPST
jgi:hypothetical protein